MLHSSDKIEKYNFLMICQNFEEAIQSGDVPWFVQFLTREDFHQLQVCVNGTLFLQSGSPWMPEPNRLIIVSSFYEFCSLKFLSAPWGNWESIPLEVWIIAGHPHSVCPNSPRGASELLPAMSREGKWKVCPIFIENLQ
jgi:hypothetical protein